MTVQQEAYFQHLPFRAKLEFLVRIHEAYDLSDALRVFNHRRASFKAAAKATRWDAVVSRKALADAVAARFAD
jgi:hypothetical protein